jgi:hypothetical protein
MAENSFMLKRNYEKHEGTSHEYGTELDCWKRFCVIENASGCILYVLLKLDLNFVGATQAMSASNSRYSSLILIL